MLDLLECNCVLCQPTLSMAPNGSDFKDILSTLYDVINRTLWLKAKEKVEKPLPVSQAV